MRISFGWLWRLIAGSLVMFLALPLAAQPQEALPAPQQGVSSVQQVQKPDSTAKKPAANTTQSSPNAPGSAASQTGNPDQPSGTAQTTAEQQQNGAPEPVGTAAAPYEKPLGVAASRPAGAVIAPAKQRRTRSILIKVGLVVAAAAAIGTVVALSKASPSRPN